MLVNYILGSLSVLSFVLLLWQWIAAKRFPLHTKIVKADFAPSISILKPLKGCDTETKACLESWLRQDYSGELQILFGVASAEDPVCAIVRELLTAYPGANAELIICSELLGPNAKVSTLIQLQKLATNEIFVVSDADVRVEKDFLSNLVQPLRDPNVGLVNCFYKYANPQTPGMRWEAIAVNADFWSQVLQSQSMKPIDFALGAVMGMRRDSVEGIGGFKSLVEFLADDYQLGNRIAKLNKRIVLSPVVVECWERKMSFGAVWKHQLRWARTIRACQAVPFFFSILSNATLWPVLWSIWLFATVTPKLAAIPLLIFLAARMFIALQLQEKLSRSLDHYSYFWLVPIKDLLNVGIWAAAFFGNEVEWRGERFCVQNGGRLVKRRA